MLFFFFFFNDTATTEIYTLSLHDALPIGTGRNATPQDAGAVHREIRGWLAGRGAPAPCVLYGGSVNAKNAAVLLAERELEGVLVGGASLDPEGWAQLVQTGAA